MIKKWTIAGMIYLLVVIASYGIYSTVIQPDSTPPHEEVAH
ncbi:hypothetical protein [Bacillus sp. B15-48]|nr:hypothetical protein [Bacillus sp. B15-48]